MKRISSLLASLVLLWACNNGSKRPDVSGIKVESRIQRFDQAYFQLDSNNLAAGMKQLQKQFPGFSDDFTMNILGAGPISDSNQVLPVANRMFFTSYYPVYKELEPTFKDMGKLEDELKDAFQLVKHYFPNYTIPQVISYIGPFDAPGVAITKDALAIGLQLYAGKDFPFYTSTQGQELFPLYISRRFEKNYIVPNCMKAVLEDMYPDNSANLPLIEQMTEKGKYWWVLDQLLPDMADSLKTGYTQSQLEWCSQNEGVIWGLLLQNDLMYNTDPGIIQMYIGDAPSTQGFPPASPGNIGQWIGRQVVRAYINKFPETTPEQLMKLPAREIIEKAKYKPR